MDKPEFYIWNSIKLPLPDTKPVNFMGHDIPEDFEIEYAVSTHSTPFDGWSVNFKVHVESDGTPRTHEVRLHSYAVGHVLKPIQRWQIESVENEFHRLLARAVTECASCCFYLRNENSGKFEWRLLEYEDVAKGMYKEVERLTHRRKLTAEHYEQVAKIYNEEVDRAKKLNRRGQMVREVMVQMNGSRGAVDLWIRGAKDRQLIQERIENKSIPILANKIAASNANRKSRAKND